MSTPRSSLCFNAAARREHEARNFTLHRTRVSPLRRSFSFLPMSRKEGRSSVVPCMKVDFIRFLPSELALAILSHLEPADLCRCTLVCRRWYVLLQDRRLQSLRLQFVEAERTAWRCNAENRIPSTPRLHSSIPCPRDEITTTTPLGVIQYKCTAVGRRRSSLTLSPVDAYLQTPVKYPEEGEGGGSGGEGGSTTSAPASSNTAAVIIAAANCSLASLPSSSSSSSSGGMVVGCSSGGVVVGCSSGGVVVGCSSGVAVVEGESSDGTVKRCLFPSNVLESIGREGAGDLSQVAPATTSSSSGKTSRHQRKSRLKRL